MMRSIFSGIFIFTSCALFASNHPPAGHFGVTGEYLYFMPSVDDTYFVTKSGVSSAYPQGTRRKNDFGFHSGYRLAGVYGFCECDGSAYVGYTHLGVSKRRTIEGDNLWAALGRENFTTTFEDYSGNAKSHLKLNYNRVDALIEQSICSTCDFNFRLLFGLEYANLSLRETNRYEFNATFGKINQRNYTWGVGPEVGFSFDYRICQFIDCLPGAFSINVVSSGSILSGKTNNHDSSTLDEDFILDVKDHGSWRLIPVFHARVGLNYTFPICENQASLEVGYEFDTYNRALARVTYPGDLSNGHSRSDFYNFDLQGLYVSATYSF